MIQKESVTVKLFAILYLILALFFLAELIAAVMLLFPVLLLVPKASDMSFGAIGLFLNLFSGGVYIVTDLLAFIFMLIISIGLFNLSSKKRAFMLFVNIIGIISALYVLYSCSLPYTGMNIDLNHKVFVAVQLVLYLLSTYFFTRADITSQFR